MMIARTAPSVPTTVRVARRTRVIAGRHAGKRTVRWTFRTHARTTRLLARHGTDLMGVARILTRDERLAEQLVIDTLTAYDFGDPDHDGLRTLAAGVMVAWLGRNRAVTGPGASDLRTTGIYDDLHALPDEQRAVLALCRFGGHTYREAADLLGLPAPTVADQLCRAMRGLQRGSGPTVS